MVDMFDVMQFLGKFIDFLGVLVIVVGMIWATVRSFMLWITTPNASFIYKEYRQNLARTILLGLEFLIAGDIISSVAVTPTFMSVGILGVIVLIRSFLGIMFEMEVDGRLPWQKTKKD